MTRSTMQIWGAPLLLAVLTIVGLTSALLGDDIWDLVSAVTLGAPQICMVLRVMRPPCVRVPESRVPARSWPVRAQPLLRCGRV